jgi:hypothetical protein
MSLAAICSCGTAWHATDAKAIQTSDVRRMRLHWQKGHKMTAFPNYHQAIQEAAETLATIERNQEDS